MRPWPVSPASSAIVLQVASQIPGRYFVYPWALCSHFGNISRVPEGHLGMLPRSAPKLAFRRATSVRFSPSLTRTLTTSVSTCPRLSSQDATCRHTPHFCIASWRVLGWIASFCRLSRRPGQSVSRSIWCAYGHLHVRESRTPSPTLSPPAFATSVSCVASCVPPGRVSCVLSCSSPSLSRV